MLVFRKAVLTIGLPKLDMVLLQKIIAKSKIYQKIFIPIDSCTFKLS